MRFSLKAFCTLSKALLIICLINFTSFHSAEAQETVQIDVVNIPSILPSPYISDFERNVRRGQYQLHANYITRGSSPVDFEFVFRLYRDRELLVEEVSRPETLFPGMNNLTPLTDRLQFERSQRDIISDLGRDLQSRIIQSGALPEGNYRLEVDANPTAGRTVQVHGGVAHFTVAHPQPPRLTSPSHDANLTMTHPVFSWTPVMSQRHVTMEYDFLMVELFEGQTPEDGIDGNRPHLETTIVNATSLVYTDEYLPLNEGANYAWRVTAGDINNELPIRNNGESEIFTFTYKEDTADPEALAELEEIELIPDILYVTGLSDLGEDQVTELDAIYLLNGPVQARLEMNYLLEPITLPANIQSLAIQKTGLENPVVSGGEVQIDLEDAPPRLLLGLEQVSLSQLDYTHGTGARLSGSYEDFQFGAITVEGPVGLTNRGLEGSLTAEEDLVSFESDLFTLLLNEIQVRLPFQDVVATADLHFLGEPANCSISRVNLAQEEWLSEVNCRELLSYDLSNGRELLEYTISQLSGTLAFNRSSQNLEYDINVNGHLGFNFVNTEPCGFRIQSSLHSEEATVHNVEQNSCTIPEPELNLGFARLIFSDFGIDQFQYNTESGEWDFDFPFEASFTFPVFNNWSHQPDELFRLTNDGIDIPSFTLNRNLPQYNHDGLNLSMNHLDLEGFQFPWFEWDGDDPGDWNLQFSGEASIAETAGLPFCLAGSVLAIEDGLVTSGQLSADLELTSLSNCTINLTRGHKIILTALGGSMHSEFGVAADGHFIASPVTNLFIEGGYEAGLPLSCTDTADTGQIASSEVSFIDGMIHGEFSIEESSCQIPIAVYDATLNEASLNLRGEDGEQKAEIESSATLHLSQNHEVNGSFVYNVMDLRFSELEFLIDEPYIWDIPADDPVLSFEINEARFDLEGLHIDGRNDLLIGDETIGATFDQVVKDLEENRIRSGQVHFDRSFAMAVSFDDGWDSPSFSAVPLSDEEETVPDAPDNGIIMELGAGIGMDHTGIFTSGETRGRIAVDNLNFGQIGIQFSEDFSFQLRPFNVGAGRADFYYNNSRIAYLDNSGFHPLISGLAEEIIPEKLPAPSINIAFIKLRDDEGELLVDFEEPEPGLIELQTIPGTPIELVLPVLDEVNPPAVAGVEFQDFVLTASPGNFSVDTGSASVMIGDEFLSDLQSQIGLPFSLEEIIYGQSEQLSDDGKYLQLFGDLMLFGERISSDANTMVKVSSGGLLSGEVQLSDLAANIPLIDQSEHLQLEVNDIQGALAMSLFDDSSFGFDLDIGSELKFGVTGNQPRSLSSFELNIQPGSLVMNDFSGLTPDEPVRVDLSRFTMNLNRVNSIPVFNYDRDEGWEFMIDLDADFEFNIAGENRFTLPMNGLQLGTNGFTIPIQEINDGTLDGKQLPSFELAGFEFQPLALRTLESMEYNWFSGEVPDINPFLDFSIYLPDFEFGDITPPDGLTFSNVTIQQGILSGEMTPYEPLGGLQIPLGPPGYNPPEFQIDEILGSLGASEVEEEIRQSVDLSLAGSIENIPFFEDPDPDCVTDIQYSLDIVEGRGFYGTLENIAPCGSVTMGPVTLSAGVGNLYLDYDNNQQDILFDGTLFAHLQGPENDVTAQGSIELDLIAGQIRDGQIAIDQPFLMSMPAIGPSFIDFVVNEAEISSQGFLLDADGHLEAGQSDIFVSFNQLLFALPDFSIDSGFAEISSGFGLQIGLSPFTASVTDADTDQPPAEEAVNMIADGTVIVDSDGLNFAGEAGASLRIAGQEMASLHVVFEDQFTHSMSSPAVNRGRAEFYSSQEQENLLAVYDSDGFNFIDALIAQLPEKLGLPSSDIAYAIIKDQDGDPVIDVESNQQGGYTLSTDEEPLSIHFPALEDEVQGEPYVDAYFTLTTDDSYVPNGGEITLVSPMSLEPFLDVPVSLDSIAIDGEENLLTTVISVDLPGAFGDITASAETTIGAGGFEEATIDIGNYTDFYQEGLEPVVQRDILAQLSGDSADSEFIMGLYGAQLSINSPAEFMLSGIAETSLLTTDDGQYYPIFYTAGYSEGWQFDVEIPGGHESADLGLGRFNLDQEHPLDITVDDDQFIVEISGHISFEEMLGENLIFSVKDLLIGAENLQDSPQLVFGLGAATAGIEGTQEFDFFEGAFAGSFTNAELFIQGRLLGASIDHGDLTFLDQNMEFEDLSVDTGGNFEIGGVAGDGAEIIGEYLVLDSVGLDWDEADGISVSSTFFFTLPEPVDETGNLNVILGRDGIDGSIFVDSEIPEDSDFNPEEIEEFDIELGSQVTVTITDILFDVDPSNITDSHIAAAGNISVMGNERIYLGESGNVEQNPGISVKNRLGQSPVKYNITGNGSFEFDHSFFSVEIDADVLSSSEDLFEIGLGGSLSSTAIPGIDEVEGNFGGMVINMEGIDEIGNIEGGVTLKFWNGIASLELGTFEHESDPQGFSRDLPGGFGQDLNDIQNGGGEADTRQLNLVEYLCFGPCENESDETALKLSLGGQSGEGGGSFTGEIEEVLFYETSDGEISFTVTNFSLQLRDDALASANLLYESNINGSQLFAAGSVELSKGGQEVSAVIAGGFSTMGDDLSFGLFAAATTSQELPIIPGVLAVSGFGGGFFYRPETEQLDMVYTAVDNLRGDPIDGLDRTITSGNSPSDQLNLESDVDLRFSFMLFAHLHVVSVMEGTTFFEITDSYLALDADGVILGMDSSPTMAGAFFLGASYNEGMHIQASIQALVEFDPVITADAGVQFFAGYTGSGGNQSLEWGLIGEIDVELFRGLISGGSSTVMASNDGFLLEVEMEAGIDRSLLTLKGYLRGSIWNLTYDGAELPFGAYGVAGGEIDIAKIISGEAVINVAFVRRSSSRYELFGYGEYAASVLGIGKSGSAWIKIMTHPIDVDAGRGEPDFDDNTIAQAQAQADEFEKMIQDAMDGLAAELGAVAAPGLELTDEDIAMAGYHFRSADPATRQTWKNLIYANEELFLELYGDTGGSNAVFRYLEEYKEWGGTRTDEDLESSGFTSWSSAEDDLNDHLDMMDQLSEETMGRLQEAVVRAIEYEYIADELRDDVTDVMASSPANIINQPTQQSIGEGNTPVFQVDDDLAASQSQQAADFSEAIEEMEDQVHAVIDSIELNIQQLESLMTAQYMPQVSMIGTDGITQFDVDYTEIQPSINAVAEHYQNTLQAIDRYYATLTNKYWHRMNIAAVVKQNTEFNFYGPLEGYVDNSINNRLYLDRSQFLSTDNTIIQSDRFYEFVEPIAERLRIFKDLIDSSSPTGTPYQFNAYPEVQEIIDELMDDIPNYELDVSGIYQNTYDFMISMHILGNEKYIEHKSEFINNELVESHQVHREDIIDIMEAHTELIDDIYNLKANMYGSLYSIIDDYVEVRRAAQQQEDSGPIQGLSNIQHQLYTLHGDTDGSDLSVLEQYEIRREEILQALQPPEISDISVNTGIGGGVFDADYYGWANIGWDIDHPVGVYEVSINMQEYAYDSDPPGFSNQLVSVGTPDQDNYSNHVVHYTYLQGDQAECSLRWYDCDESANTSTRNVDLVLRARSAGGITAQRQATFQIPVARGGQGTSPGDNILPEITAPPTDLMVDLESEYNRTQETITWNNYNPITQQVQTVSMPLERFWTSDPANIQVRALVSEPVSSIRGYEYSVGSSVGGEDVIGTTDLIGSTERYPDEPGNWTDLIEAITRIFNMQPGEGYYLSVEAFNIGDLGIREEVPVPVVYDDTPPSAPEAPEDLGLQIFTGIFNPFGQSPMEAEPFVTLPPSYNLSYPEQTSGFSTGETPGLGIVEWQPSEDNLSGVSHYEYLITTDEGYTDTQFSFNGFTTEETNIEITSGDSRHDGLTFDFDDYMHVHIRAVNHAGLASEVYTHSQFPFDPNPPTAPVIAGYNAPDHIRIYLKERAYDGESGIKGFQYSVGTNAGASDIRSWPDDTDVDFEADYELDQAFGVMVNPSSTAPYLEISKSDLPEGQELYFNVKALNNQDTESDVVSTGPIILDSTPPAEPVVSLDVKNNGNKLEITVDNIYDGVSGVAGVYATVLPDDFPYHLATPSWEDIGNISSVRHDNFSLTVTYDVPSNVSVYELNVTVRVQNAAGLESNATESVPAPYIPVFNPVTFQSFSF